MNDREFQEVYRIIAKLLERVFTLECKMEQVISIEDVERALEAYSIQLSTHVDSD